MQPGGYVDVAELEGVLRSDDNTVPEGSSLKAITYCYSEGLKKVGLPQHSGLEMKAMVEAAGFVDVEVCEPPWMMKVAVLMFTPLCASCIASSNHLVAGPKIQF